MKNYFYLQFVKLISIFIIYLDKIIQILFRKYNLKNFLPKIHDIIENKQYYSQIINNKNINFFCPSEISLIRVQTLYVKEPETINWINDFKINDKKTIFWDIGSNIGLYSLYAAIIHEKLRVISFEPSTSNTRILSRNISINNLSHKIKIFQLALCDRPNILSHFNETKFQEGWAHSTFDDKIDSIGNKLSDDKIMNKYQIFGTNIDSLIDNNLVEVPNYIKIDVDGIEHLILSGAKNLLKNEQLKEILVELSPDFSTQFNLVEKILFENNFEKIISTNKRLLKDPNYKLKKGETLNTIYKRKILTSLKN